MRRVIGGGTGDDLEARARWLIRQARRLGSNEEWSLLYELEIALLTLARQAPLEDGRWSRLAFDVECRLGELEAIAPLGGPGQV